MTTLERVEQIYKDLQNTVEAKLSTHVQIEQIMQFHISAVKKEENQQPENKSS